MEGVQDARVFEAERPCHRSRWDAMGGRGQMRSCWTGILSEKGRSRLPRMGSEKLVAESRKRVAPSDLYLRAAAKAQEAELLKHRKDWAV